MAEVCPETKFNTLYIGYCVVTKFESIRSSNVVGQKIMVRGLPDADRQRYIEIFKSLGIDKSLRDLRTQRTDDSIQQPHTMESSRQHDHRVISKERHCNPIYSGH